MPPIPHRPPHTLTTRKAICLNEKRTTMVSDRIAKAASTAKKKVTKQADRFCKICAVSGSCSKTFYDNINSKRHENGLYNKNTNFFYTLCKRTFMCYQDLAAHRTSAAHLKE